MTNHSYLWQRLREADEYLVLSEASTVSKGETDGPEAGFLGGEKDGSSSSDGVAQTSSSFGTEANGRHVVGGDALWSVCVLIGQAAPTHAARCRDSCKR